MFKILFFTMFFLYAFGYYNLRENKQIYIKENTMYVKHYSADEHWKNFISHGSYFFYYPMYLVESKLLNNLFKKVEDNKKLIDNIKIVPE